MVWYALEEIEGSFDDAREKLTPFSLKTWGLYAVIILLTGYTLVPSMGVPSGADLGEFEQNGFDRTGSMHDVQTGLELGGTPGFEMADTSVLIAALVIGLFLGILALIVTSIFQFVLYRSVMDGRPRVSLARNYLSEGLKYAGFRVAAGIVTVLAIATGILAIIAAPITALIVIPGLIVFYILISGLRWLVFHYTIPSMIKNEEGIVDGIKSAFNIFRNNIGQTVLFWFVKWVLSLAVGIAGVLLLVSAGLILLIPFGLVAYLLYSASPILAAPVLAIYGLGMLLVSLYLAVPIRVYIYQYILNVFEGVTGSEN